MPIDRPLGNRYNPPPRGMVSNISSFYIQGYNDGYEDGLEARGEWERSRSHNSHNSHNSHAGIGFESDVEHTAQLGPIKVKRRKRNKWVLFLKRFKFRKKKKGESGRRYLALRTKAAARAWKKVKK
jgi:hypothetical protein